MQSTRLLLGSFVIGIALALSKSGSAQSADHLKCYQVKDALKC